MTYARFKSLMVISALFLGTANVASAADIAVGIELPLTGIVSAWAGVPTRNGVDLAVEEVNRDHEMGDLTMRALIEDCASDKTQSITLANRFIERDKVAMVIGPVTSPLAAAVAPIAAAKQTPILMMATTDAINAAGPYAFKMYQDTNFQIKFMGDYILDHVKPKTMILVYDRDNDGYGLWARTLRQRFEGAGIKVLAQESTSATDTDFTALATKIASLQPDAIFFSTVAEVAANVVIQSRQAGMEDSTRILGAAGVAVPQYFTIGGAAINGTTYIADYFVGSPSPTNQRFVAAFRAKYHTDPDMFAAIGYTSVKVAAAAIRAAGPSPTRDSIREALARTTDLPSVMGGGSVSIDRDRNPSYGDVMLMWENGKQVLAR